MYVIGKTYSFTRILRQHNYPPLTAFTMAKSTGGGKLCCQRIQRKSFDIQCFLVHKTLYIEGFYLNPSTTQLSTTGRFRHGESCRWWKDVLVKDSDKILQYTMFCVPEDIIYRRILSESFDNTSFHHRQLSPWRNRPVVESCVVEGFEENPLIYNVLCIRRHCISKDFL